MSIAFIIFNFLILVSIFIYFHIYINVKFKSNSIINSFRKEIDKIIIEMNQATDKNINLFEVKIDSLNRLLKEADSKIELLDYKVQNTDSPYKDVPYENKKYSNPSLFSDNQDYNISSIEKDIIRENYDIRRKVINLYEQGLSLDLIAKKLKLDIGEVELIISISRIGND